MKIGIVGNFSYFWEKECVACFVTNKRTFLLDEKIGFDVSVIFISNVDNEIFSYFIIDRFLKHTQKK